ncbi:protection of telomeres protein 1 isoform X2 [Synchiropus splendidus]|uniref:protection of telomeres protein 1 isoform X2 n=1 Tax=Synchiropus splendidus TaxID=270530 RepID=UPI00237EC012|nr:protection of telomeres protein 1 isoform X2 [Synchiropus splendidus]
MPVHVLPRDGKQKNTVPTHLTVIPIPLICINTDFTGKAVKGNVSWKGPLVSLPEDNFVIKVVIEGKDDSPSTSINVILFGHLAKDFYSAAKIADVVVASGFTVGKSPTAHKDKLHPYNLLLKGDNAFIYVSQKLLAAPRSTAAVKRTTKHPPEAPRPAKIVKYTYTKIADLKAGTVVNVYGVVVFFKPPYQSRGTDICSSVNIIDQSNRKVCCTIFCAKITAHPQILRVGDIIRMHRLKAQSFNGTLNLISTAGFSVVTFDGAVDRPIEPRTSCRSFVFDEDDRLTVEELRSWAATNSVLPPTQMVVLSEVQPNTFFDLTCQLLAKATVDSNCVMLRVWDGTRCPHKMLNVVPDPNSTDGPTSFPDQQKDFILNIFVYDNHVQQAEQLKPGDFLRVYNIHASLGSDKEPGVRVDTGGEGCHLTLALHGGTSYGKGIQVIPETSPDLMDMKRIMNNIVDDIKDSPSDSDMLDVWVTPPESPGRMCTHRLQSVSLAEVKQSDPGGRHHVRVQLKSYEPQLLYQSLKLHCSECLTLQEVPDDDAVARIFEEALGDSRLSSPAWLIPIPISSTHRSKMAYVFRQVATNVRSNGGLLLRGCTLEEACQLTTLVTNVVPVRESEGRIALLDLTAPFLFRGKRRFYGCKHCSNAQLVVPQWQGVHTINEELVAKAFGIQMLKYVLLFKLELQDATGTLDALLWRDAETFFSVSADDAATNQEAQDNIRQTMDFLCPQEGSKAERPWLEVCLATYQPDDSQNQTCYQICDTTVHRPA